VCAHVCYVCMYMFLLCGNCGDAANRVCHTCMHEPMIVLLPRDSGRNEMVCMPTLCAGDVHNV
jgi:hypothetical protein